MKVLLCIVTGSLLSLSINAQWSSEKIQHKREVHHRISDSAWSYLSYRIIWMRHNFLGTQKVSFKNYLKGMQDADDETAALISKYKTRKIIAGITFTGGFSALIVWGSLFTSSPLGIKTPPGLLIAGAGLFATGVTYGIMANLNLTKATRLFNLKARENTLSKIKRRTSFFNFGLQRRGVGIALHF